MDTIALVEQSPWTQFGQRDQLSLLDYPGVYLFMAIDSPTQIPPLGVLPQDLLYIGMTKRPLRRRMQEFEKSLIQFEAGHSGARRLVELFTNLDNRHIVLKWNIPNWLYMSVVAIKVRLPENAINNICLDLENDFICHYAALYGDKPICNKA